MIDEATRFHVAEVVHDQHPETLYDAIMHACIKWDDPPKFVLVEPHMSQK